MQASRCSTPGWQIWHLKAYDLTTGAATAKATCWHNIVLARVAAITTPHTADHKVCSYSQTKACCVTCCYSCSGRQKELQCWVHWMSLQTPADTCVCKEPRPFTFHCSMRLHSQHRQSTVTQRQHCLVASCAAGSPVQLMLLSCKNSPHATVLKPLEILTATSQCTPHVTCILHIFRHTSPCCQCVLQDRLTHYTAATSSSAGSTALKEQLHAGNPTTSPAAVAPSCCCSTT